MLNHLGVTGRRMDKHVSNSMRTENEYKYDEIVTRNMGMAIRLGLELGIWLALWSTTFLRFDFILQKYGTIPGTLRIQHYSCIPEFRHSCNVVFTALTLFSEAIVQFNVELFLTASSANVLSTEGDITSLLTHTFAVRVKP